MDARPARKLLDLTLAYARQARSEDCPDLEERPLVVFELAAVHVRGGASVCTPWLVAGSFGGRPEHRAGSVSCRRHTQGEQ